MMSNQSETKHDLSASQVYREIEDNQNLVQGEFDGKIITFKTKTTTSNLSSIERFVERVITTGETGFKKIQNGRSKDNPTFRFKASKLGNFFTAINSFITSLYQNEEYYIYSENVSLFLEGCNALNLGVGA